MSAKPNFIGVGAQKCATTWLYDILVDHPEVCMSAEKEIDFFSKHFDFGYQWYERHFAPRADCRAVGEISPSYFHGVSVPERIRAYDPAVRLLLFLREPVARAISNHKHEIRMGHVQGADLSFEFGLRNNPQYIEQGLYATHLERWLSCFPREQILIVLFDAVRTDGRAVARQVYEFLDLDAQHRPAALNTRSNESYVNRSEALEGAKNSFRHVVRSAGLGFLWQAVGRLGLRSAYRAVNRAAPETVIPPLAPGTLEFLGERFANEIVRLEELTGMDLSAWRHVQKERAHG